MNNTTDYTKIEAQWAQRATELANQPRERTLRTNANLADRIAAAILEHGGSPEIAKTYTDGARHLRNESRSHA